MHSIKTRFEPLLIGRSPFDINAIMYDLNATLYNSLYAQAAIGDALYDLVGKSLNVPVHALLGGKCRDRVRVGAVLGTRPPLPDNRMDGIGLLDIVKRVEEVVEEVEPNIVYTHHGGDLNIDHRITHQAVMTACRPVPGSKVGAMYACEIPSSTEWASTAIGEPFRPTHFVDIGSHMSTKLQALDCYEGEMRAFPHARSLRAVETLANLRGSRVGVDAAGLAVRPAQGAGDFRCDTCGLRHVDTQGVSLAGANIAVLLGPPQASAGAGIMGAVGAVGRGVGAFDLGADLRSRTEAGIEHRSEERRVGEECRSRGSPYP